MSIETGKIKSYTKTRHFTKGRKRMLKNKFLLISFLLVVVGLSLACGVGVSPREQALEATVAALQNQVATSSAPLIPATATPIAAPDWRKQYIGFTYPPLPEGWEDIGGAITFSNCAFGSPCASGEETYAVAQWRRTDQPQETAETLLLFKKLVGYDLEGRKPFWVVLDILVGSEIGGSNWLWQGCRVGGNLEIDNEIVALYGIITDPSSPLWRANHLTGRFEPISPDGITCVDENAVN